MQAKLQSGTKHLRVFTDLNYDVRVVTLKLKVNFVQPSFKCRIAK